MEEIPELMNTKPRSVFSALLGLGLFALPSLVNATVYQYDVTNPPHNGGAGDIDSIGTTYDSATHELTFQTSVTGNGTYTPNGFWVVLSDGPNPKGISDQLPIVYLDASKSFDAAGAFTGIEPTLSAYAYNGQNGFTSYSTPGVGLISSLGSNWNAANVVTASGDATNRTFSFSIDTSLLDNASAVGTIYAADGQAFNPANWEGAGYNSQIGVWFHATDTGGVDPTYNASGYLTSATYAAQSGVDNSYQGTTVVPEPSSALLFAIAGMVLVHRRSRRFRA